MSKIMDVQIWPASGFASRVIGPGWVAGLSRSPVALVARGVADRPRPRAPRARARDPGDPWGMTPANPRLHRHVLAALVLV